MFPVDHVLRIEKFDDLPTIPADAPPRIRRTLKIVSLAVLQILARLCRA